MLADRAIDAMTPIGLDELVDRASLLTRLDRKYIVPLADLPAVLAGLPRDVRVLDIDGRRDFGYRSRYFDTPGLRQLPRPPPIATDAGSRSGPAATSTTDLHFARGEDARPARQHGEAPGPVRRPRETRAAEWKPGRTSTTVRTTAGIRADLTRLGPGV